MLPEGAAREDAYVKTTSERFRLAISRDVTIEAVKPGWGRRKQEVRVKLATPQPFHNLREPAEPHSLRTTGNVWQWRGDCYER